MANGNGNGRRIPPSDLEAESSVLGAMFCSTEAASTAVRLVKPEQFYRPAHQAIFAAAQQCYNAGEGVDVVTVAHRLDVTGMLEQVGGKAELMELQAFPGAIGNVGRYIAIVVEASDRRGVISQSSHAAEAAYDWTRPLAQAYDLLSPPADVAVSRTPVYEAAQLCATTPADHDWVIAGLLERADRVIITGDEGKGKSTLLRQFALCSASGIHPFNFSTIPAVPVLAVDVENSLAQVGRALRPLLTLAGSAYRGLLSLVVRTEGFDLTDARDVNELVAIATDIAPRLITIGPLYKLAHGAMRADDEAPAIARAFDRLRERTGAAVVIEAHAPLGAKDKRPQRVSGSALWLRWPEFGLHVTDTGQLIHWRGAREERTWPTHLAWGGPDTWPWVTAAGPDPVSADAPWAPTECVERVVSVCDATPDPLSINQIVTIIKERFGGNRKAIVLAAVAAAADAGRIETRGFRAGHPVYGRPTTRLPDPDEAF